MYEQRNELYHDRVILVEHLTKNLPDVDVPKLLGHSLDDEPISAVLPEGASLSRMSLPSFLLSSCRLLS